MHKPSEIRKYSNKRKSQGREDRVHPQAENLGKLKRKEERKNAQGKKGKNSPFSSNISNSNSTTDLYLESETSVTNKRFKVLLKGEEFKEYRVYQSLF